MSHPRPHLIRRRWQSLDGSWSFEFDPDDVGERQGWFLPGRDRPLRIQVPFPWESPRSGVGPPAPDRYARGSTSWLGSIGWYARRISIPVDWVGQRIWLVVGAAYWETSVWIDGRAVGQHVGGYLPFDLDISDLVAGVDEAELTIRVRAPEDSDQFPHGKNTRHWYSRSSGIWQSVFIEPRPAAHIAALGVVPDPETGELEAALTVRATAAGPLTARIEVFLAGERVASVEDHVQGASGGLRHVIRASVTEPRLWDCESPTLYDVRVRLTDADGAVDVVETSVGFRSIAFRPIHEGGPRWLHLNGKPIYLRAVMSQGYHPDGILAYPDEEVIAEDLATAKRLGFNMVRLHVKVEDPRLLACADRLGILLWCEVPDFLTPTPAALERWELTWRGMLERDSGHPSIALWCMFIESWGLGLNQFGFGGAVRRFADDPEMQRWVADMYDLGRLLDPTRPIIENSVSEADHTVAEVNDMHLFPSGYGDLTDQAQHELDGWLAGAFPGSEHNFVPGYRQARQPLLVSSMAGWSSVDGVETSFPLHALVNAVRSRERIAGYGWVQLYDVEWELTGLLTYERRAKAFGYEIVDLNADDVLVVDGSPVRRTSLGQPINVAVALAHGSGRVAGAVTIKASLEGLTASGQRMRTELGANEIAAVVRRRGVIELGVLQLPSPSEPFAGRLVVTAGDASGRAVARSHVHCAWLAGADAEPDSCRLPMTLASWTTSLPSEPEWLCVDGSPQRAIATSLVNTITLPGTPGRSGDRVVSLLVEAAIVGASTAGQSLEQMTVAPVEVLLDEAVIADVTLPMLTADSRGTLSIIHAEGLGTYGDLLSVPLGRQADLAGRERTVEVRPRDPGGHLRVVFFGPLLGQAPLGPTLLFREPT